jgi:hypothetical protein
LYDVVPLTPPLSQIRPRPALLPVSTTVELWLTPPTTRSSVAGFVAVMSPAIVIVALNGETLAGPARLIGPAIVAPPSARSAPMPLLPEYAPAGTVSADPLAAVANGTATPPDGSWNP